MEEPFSPFTPTTDTKIELDFFTKYRYIILGLLLITLGVGVYLTLTPPSDILTGEDVQLASGVPDTSSQTISGADQVDEIVVDIAGGVQNPGVFYLPVGSIIENAIEASGGFSTRTDVDEVARSINRAEEVSNHSKIYIPKIGDNKLVYLNPSSTTNPATNSLINLNTAGLTELTTLPGIGEITAQRIIDYRLEHGSFKTPEDIMNVPGISDGKFNSIKNQITV